jgi:hypothetical protein
MERLKECKRCGYAMLHPEPHGSKTSFVKHSVSQVVVLEIQFFGCGPPIPEMDVDTENGENGDEYDENEDDNMEEYDDGTERWQEEEEELLLRIECSSIHDLSVLNDRIAAAIEVFGAVNYFQSSTAAETNLN